MAVRRAWYKSQEYKQPFDKRTLGDGSTVECCLLAIVGEDGSITHRLTRVYPWGYEQVIEFYILPHGETKYTRQDPGPASPVAHLSESQRKRQFEESVAAGELNIVARGAVPGQGISDTYSHEIRRTVATSDEFERESERLRFARCMRSDYSTMHRGGDPSVSSGGGGLGSIEAFDASRGGVPPLPKRG